MDRVGTRTAGVVGVAALLTVMAITLAVGMLCFDGRKIYITVFLLLLEGLAVSFVWLERRRLPAREVVLTATLCALGVAGRAAFFALPQMKPVSAIVIVSGAAFGPRTGFLTGALTAFFSNFLFGQGPWTPWQMAAWGLMGALSGVLARGGILKANKWQLSLYGFVVTLVLYGAIMNFQSVLMMVSELTLPAILAGCAAGLPFDLIHAGSTAVFLALFGQPFLRKLRRVQIKYGIEGNFPLLIQQSDAIKNGGEVL